MAISVLNAKADHLRARQALATNCIAARGLQEIIKGGLGPRGTLKMLVGGAGQIKITKDGSVLLHEMQIQHPTASIIARAATAQDEITGDGTTSAVLLIGELLRICEALVSDGVHPRILCDGIDQAVTKAINMLPDFRIRVDCTSFPDRDILVAVARSSLRTKLPPKLADNLVGDIVEAVHVVWNARGFSNSDVVTKHDKETLFGGAEREKSGIDLFMVEVMHMKTGMGSNTRLVKGLVLDHGCRHPDMPKSAKNCYVLTLNVSLEYEKSEVNSGFFYSDVAQRETLVASERRFTDEKVQKVIDLYDKICPPGSGKSMIVVNQKGIDPPALEMLAAKGIMGLRRAKRRNMERIALCCGGEALNSVEDISEDNLGWCESVSEIKLEDETYTIMEGVKSPRSCTLLVQGPNDHTIAQIKDAIRDGLRAVKNVLDDGTIMPGAASFELALHHEISELARSVGDKSSLGIRAFADACLIIPQTLADNAGHDGKECVIAALAKYAADKTPIGINLDTGAPMKPDTVYDNECVKTQMLSLVPTLAQQLLLVDEIIRAGKA